MTRTASTPSLDRLLDALRRRLRAHVLLHGLGRVLLGAACWLALIYLLDRWLHLPGFVRGFHALVLLALPAYLLWRELLRPLSRVPDRDGLAVLIERSHPELHELLVSAVQLERRAGELSPDERLLVERVIADAEARARELDLSGVDDPRPPISSLGAGAAAAALCGLLLALSPADASIFMARLLGGGPEWPRRTTLRVEVPVAGGRAQVETVDGELRVLCARGSDVPVVVRADGVVPDEVTLFFSSGRREVLASPRGGVFRTLLRSVQEDLSFHVTGGDDRDRDPLVVLTVLQPPDVSALAVTVEPPAYSGLAARVVRDRDVEVLAGSRVRVAMVPDPPDATGVVRVLPEDRELPLEPVDWPAEESAAGEDAAAPRAALGFELVAAETLRYRFELVDSTGLPNPDPGLFAVHVVEDRPPEVEVLAPARGEVETVVGGAVPLRVRAFDDFGVARLEWSAEVPGEGVGSASQPLDARPLEIPSDGGTPRRGQFASRTLEAGELAGGGELIEGQLFELDVVALDGREPVPQVGKAPQVRVRVVSVDELMRRVQDRLARSRVQVGELVELQREKHRRTLELLASLEGDQPADAASPAEIGAALTGQRRVQGDARALARELASVAETVLYARVDERAAPLLAELDRRSSELTDRSFHPEVWSALAERSGAGTGLADKLVGAAALAVRTAEEEATRAAEKLREAQDAGDLPAMQAALASAEADQRAALSQLELLLERLAEWDNFQSVLSLTRDILNRQKNLLERTKRFAKEN